jgi:hypothetical protein
LSVQDFQVAVNPIAEVVKAGATPTPHTINITGQAGFSGTVTLACSSGLPALSTCTFSANPVSAGGSSTLTIQTTAPSVSLARPPAGGRPAPLNALWTTIPGLVVGLLGLGVSPGRRRGKRGKLLSYAGLVLLLALLVALTACGGGGGSTTTTPPPPIPKPGTPAGTYTVMVSATSTLGSPVQSAQVTKLIPITLTVQ